MAKLLLLKSNFHKAGGLEKYAWRSAIAFAKRGLEVTIVTTGDKKRFPSNPRISYKILRELPLPNFLRIEEYDYLCRKIQKEMGAEIVFSLDRNRTQTHLRAGNGVHAAYLKSRWAEGKLKKISCMLNPLHRTILRIEKQSFEDRSLKKLITNSQMVKDEVLTYYRTDPKKIAVVHNGVEWFEMESDFNSWIESSKNLRCQLKIPQNHFIFLFIGNGYQRKGLKLLLQALSLIKDFHFHLVIIGKDRKANHFVALAEKLGLKNKTSFLGQISKIRPFYQLCDSLVIPSFYDPFANVTLEALAMGLYVITSKFNGGYEVLPKEDGVILEDLFNIDEMVEALKKAMKKPKTTTLANQIRNSVKHLDFSSQLTKLVDTVLDNA